MELPLDYVSKTDGKSFLYDKKGNKRYIQIHNLKALENGDLSCFMALNVPSADGTRFLQGPAIPITLPLKQDSDKLETLMQVTNRMEYAYRDEVNNYTKTHTVGAFAREYISCDSLEARLAAVHTIQNIMQKNAELELMHIWKEKGILFHSVSFESAKKNMPVKMQNKAKEMVRKDKNNKSRTLVVNLLGGPGSGKSTTMAGLFSALKVCGVNAEECSEWIKNKVYDGDKYPFENQIFTFAQQLRKQDSMDGKVDYIISDSPLVLSAFYGNDKYSRPEFNKLVLAEFRRFNNLNIFIERPSIDFKMDGRVHNEKQSKEIDTRIKKFMNDNHIPFVVVNANENIVDNILQVIAKHNKDMRVLEHQKKVLLDKDKYHRKVFAERVTLECMPHNPTIRCLCVQFSKVGALDGAKAFLTNCEMTNSQERGKKVIHFPKESSVVLLKNNKELVFVTASKFAEALYKDQQPKFKSEKGYITDKEIEIPK